MHLPPPQACPGAPSRDPLLLCETCADHLTSQILPGAYTLSGQEEACCEACWPMLAVLGTEVVVVQAERLRREELA